MKAFILAAGFGERLRPLTESTPKPLIPIDEIPIICYSIMLLKEAGITDIVCNLHYRHEDIINFFKKNNNFNLNITFSIEGEILGTGGGLKKCESILDDDFILINSDIITDVDLKTVVKQYKETASPGMVLLYKSDEDKQKTVSINNNLVVDFKNFLNSNIEPQYDFMGIAVLSPLIFKYLKSNFSSVVYTGFTDFIQYHTLEYYIHNGLWEDIGTIDAYNKVNSVVKNTALKNRLIEMLP